MNDKSSNVVEKHDYLNLLYSADRRPNTDYPIKFASYIKHTFLGKNSGKLIDIGCGRGDMLKAFHEVGMDVVGSDLSPAASKLCEPHKVFLVNFEQNSSAILEDLGVEKNSMDFVFSKSLIEHLNNPLPVLETAYELLKPGGVAIIMTPSWFHTRWGPFYLDYTHVTPFTVPSLNDAMRFAGFKKVNVHHFYQLPFVWRHSFLKIIPKLINGMRMPYQPMYDGILDLRWPSNLNKLIRFSRELMICAVAVKET